MEKKQREQHEQADGNTETSDCKVKRGRHWEVTINNVNEMNKNPRSWDRFDKYVFQLERGENGGHIHIQGYIYQKKMLTFASLKKIFPGAHLKQAFNPKALIAYCQKEKTRIEGPWVKNIPKPLKLITNLRGWQKEIETLVGTEPDDRTIHWYWNPKGCAGKTVLSKYLHIKHQALPLGGAKKDCLYGVSEWVSEYSELKVALFDIERSHEDYVSYAAIEKIKDGLFFSTKYESKVCCYNSPHVIVFANFLPKLEALSADRWHVVRIDDEENEEAAAPAALPTSGRVARVRFPNTMFS